MKKNIEIVSRQNYYNININTYDDLYNLYNDFLIDTKEQDFFIEFARDNYKEIFETLPENVVCDIETFENFIINHKDLQETIELYRLTWGKE